MFCTSCPEVTQASILNWLHVKSARLLPELRPALDIVDITFHLTNYHLFLNRMPAERSALMIERLSRQSIRRCFCRPFFCLFARKIASKTNSAGSKTNYFSGATAVLGCNLPREWCCIMIMELSVSRILDCLLVLSQHSSNSRPLPRMWTKSSRPTKGLDDLIKLVP